jgi:hypothetical protein
MFDVSIFFSVTIYGFMFGLSVGMILSIYDSCKQMDKW